MVISVGTEVIIQNYFKAPIQIGRAVFAAVGIFYFKDLTKVIFLNQ